MPGTRFSQWLSILSLGGQPFFRHAPSAVILLESHHAFLPSCPYQQALVPDSLRQALSERRLCALPPDPRAVRGGRLLRVGKNPGVWCY